MIVSGLIIIRIQQTRQSKPNPRTRRPKNIINKKPRIITPTLSKPIKQRHQTINNIHNLMLLKQLPLFPITFYFFSQWTNRLLYLNNKKPFLSLCWICYSLIVYFEVKYWLFCYCLGIEQGLGLCWELEAFYYIWRMSWVCESLRGEVWLAFD